MRPFRPLALLRRPLRALGVALAALAVGGPLGAQALAFRTFRLTDGLPQSQVMALTQDRQGFVWVGTNAGGVARVGASGIRTFSTGQGVRAQSIRDLMESPDGAMWAASLDAGVTEIRGTEVRNFGPAEGLESLQTFALAVDPASGEVLVGARAGLFRHAGARFTRVALPGEWKDLPIVRIAREPGGALWLASRPGHLARWDGRTLEPRPMPKGMEEDLMRDLQVDPQGRLWALTSEALIRLDPDGWHKVPLEGYRGQPRWQSLRFGADGSMVIAMGGEGVWLRTAAGRAEMLTPADGLPPDGINVAFRDADGRLWLGSDGDGLSLQALPGLRALSLPGAGGRSDLGAVMRIRQLGPGDFLMATSSGLRRWQAGKGFTGFWGQAEGLPSNQLWAMLPDGRGGVWVGSERGLARWRDGKVRPDGARELSKSAIVQLVRHKGRLWAGTEEGVYELDEEGKLIARHPLPGQLGFGDAFNLLDMGDELMVGTAMGLWGLKDGTFGRRYPDAPFADRSVTAMALDERRRLWIGTVQGVYVLNEGHWDFYGVKDGMPDENVVFIADLGGGRMAVGHSRGVTFLGGGPMQHLGRRQGLVTDETNHDGFLLDDQGRFWIGMIGGVNVLERARDYRIQDRPTPVVLGVSWPDGQALWPSSLALPPRPRVVQVDFDLPSPSLSGALRVEAILEGVDRQWRPVEPGNPLQYLHLTHGQYRFRVRATTDGSAWTEGTPLDLSVRPAWHERWSVRILLGLAAIAAVAGVASWRIRRLARQAEHLERRVHERTEILAHQNVALEQAHQQIKRTLESRMRFVDMVAHDLRSPLTSILLSTDRLRDASGEVSEQEAVLNILANEAHRIEGLMRKLLDRSRSEALLQGLKLERTSPLEVLQGIEEVLRLKAEAKGLGFHLEMDGDLAKRCIQADPSALQQVLFNLFENALKFTPPGGRVGIRAHANPYLGAFRLEVWDTGRGLDPVHLESILQPFAQAEATDAGIGWGLGLSICRSLVEAHRGSLRAEGAPGQGATFIVTLPLVEETQ